MRTIYLDLWDNYEKDAVGRLEELQEVIDAVEIHGEIEVSFSYNGRTRHLQAAEVMAEMLPEGYKTKIDHNYEFKIWK